MAPSSGVLVFCILLETRYIRLDDSLVSLYSISLNAQKCHKYDNLSPVHNSTVHCFCRWTSKSQQIKSMWEVQGFKQKKKKKIAYVCKAELSENLVLPEQSYWSWLWAMNHLKLHVFKKTDRKRGRKQKHTAVWQGLTREKTALDPSLVNRFVLLTEAISLSKMYDLSPPGPTLPPHPPPHTHTHTSFQQSSLNLALCL